MLMEQVQKSIIMVSGQVYLQTIEIEEPTSYKLDKRVREDSEILQVLPLNDGRNNKAITLVTAT